MSVPGYGYWGDQDTQGEPLMDGWSVPGLTAQNLDYPVVGSTLPFSVDFANDVAFAEVTGQYFDASMNALGGYLSFQPSADLIIDQEGETWRVPARLSGFAPYGMYTGPWNYNMENSGKNYIQYGKLDVMLMCTDSVQGNASLTSYPDPNLAITPPTGHAFVYIVEEHFNIGGLTYQITVPSINSGQATGIGSLIIEGTVSRIGS